VVYTGGFPALSVLRLLRHLVQTAPATPHLFHWGDVDAGGVRIVKYLEDSIGIRLRLHLMDADIVERYGRPGRAMVGRLLRYRGAAGDLARIIDENGLLLEQEVVDPAPVALDMPL
jgi:hypothetical protein